MVIIMKKLLISVSLVILVLTLLLTACKKKEGENYGEGTTSAGSTTETTTVPEYSTESNGEVYITNKNGDHIPVTTSKDGAMEMYDYLVTKTAEQVEKEKQEQKNGGATKQADAGTTKASAETTSSGSIVIGNDSPDSEEHAAVIDWS